MNHSAEFPSTHGTRRAAGLYASPPLAPVPCAEKPASSLPLKLFFLLCAGLVASHLLVVSFAPRFADAIIYALWAVAIFTYAGIVFVQARSASGMLSLRWLLFALSLLFYGLNDLRAMAGEISAHQAPQLDSLLLAIAGSLVLLSITLPSGEGIARLHLLDITVALVFCALRFLQLKALSAPGEPISSVLGHYTFDPLVRVALVLVALSVSPWAKRKLYKNIAFYLVADLFATFCCNQVGYLWSQQHTASPWTLTGTLVPLAGAIFLLGTFTNAQSQSRIQVAESRNPLLRTLLPFAMTLLIVILSTTLFPTHSYVAKFGMAFAAAAFLMRVALLARQQDLTERSLRNALRHQNWQLGPDPLDKVEPQDRFGPALWAARSHVTRDTPLSLLVLKVEEVADGLVLVETDFGTGNLIHIARHLSQWRPTHSSIYYFGDSSFAMLLPSTRHRSAQQLAEQIRISIDALGLLGENGFMQVAIGTATAITPTEADRLITSASDDLPDASAHRGWFRSAWFRMSAPAR